MINLSTYGRLLMAKKKYFPNNWKEYKHQPDWFFHPIPYEEFMDWKMMGWEIPSSVAAIIREQDLETGKVKEYVYSTVNGANKRCRKIMQESKSEFIVCSQDDIAHMFPKDLIVEDSIYDHPDNRYDEFIDDRFGNTEEDD
jgi:hypothetical protein